jgi:hypothetical protein
MPVVTTYGGRRVGAAPIPGARRTAAETPTSTGVGLEGAKADTAQTIAALGSRVAGIGIQQFAELQQKERDRADNVAILNASTELTKWENERLYNPNGGALTVKGKDAFPLPEMINGEFDTKAGEIEAGLGTDRQRQEFARVKASRAVNLDATIRRHVFGEMQHYEQQELQSSIETHTSAAIANAMDPRRVGVELQASIDAIKVHGPQMGLGPEAVKKQIENVQSATHVGVVNRLLANDQTKAAKIYFEEAKGQISGEALANIEKALEEGGLRADSQKKADEIVNAGGSLADQRAKVKAIDDPKLRDLVEQRIEHEAAIKEKQDRDTEEQTLTGAYTLVDRTHDVNSIPVNVWANLPGHQRAGLRSYAEHLARGVPVETDLASYYGLIQKAGTDPEAFATENLLAYRGKLGEAEFKQLAGLQLSIRSGDRSKTDHQLASFRTSDQVLSDSLAEYGIDAKAKPGTPDDKAIAQLRRMLDRRVEDFSAANNGKKPTATDVQMMMDGILTQQTTVPGSWWNIWPGGKSFTDTTQRTIRLTIGDVPTTERAIIERRLRANGLAVSEQTVLDAYIERQSRIAK